MKLTTAQWVELSTRLDEGLDLPEEARLQWLERLTGLDESLKSVLGDLLDRHEKRDSRGLPGTLPNLPAPSAGIHTSANEHPMPAVVGPYRVLALVGQGGMGTVYEAEQEHPRRTVALKVVKPGLTAPEVLRRFEQESQSLARLQHPGIAQIYEAGIANNGLGPQPWFAMEYIRGLSLVEFSRARQLNTAQRLEIVMKVCEAVHHAHLRGIIHRDLKPANILVDESGQPKIVDFGVARITDGNAQSAGETHLGDLVGTLAYMSPEQVLADPLEVDARSDVYTLGVILYELLAGRMPYLVTGRLTQAMRAIREESPVSLGKFGWSYRGDLETIVAKALAKDKTQRYDSAAELSADLRRYLTHEAILARPPTASYQIRKFAARNKGLAGTVAAVFVALVAGLVATGQETIRANSAERGALAARDRAAAAERSATADRNRALLAEHVANSERIQAQQDRTRAVEQARLADDQSASAKAVSDFLQNDLLAQAGSRAQAGANSKPDPDLKVRAALDRAAARIAGKFDSQPLVEASIRQTIGSAYTDLGLWAKARPQMERALDLRRRILGPEHRDTLISMNSLGTLYREVGDFGRAEALLNETLEIRRRLKGIRDPGTIATMSDLATLTALGGGDYARSEAMLAKVLEIQVSARREESPDTLAVMNNLAAEYVNQGKYDKAENLYTKVVDAKRRVLGEEHPETLRSMTSLGVVNRYQGKYAQAEALLVAVLQVKRRVLGEEHQDTLSNVRSLALLYQAEGRYEQAAPLLIEVLAASRRVLGEQHHDTLGIMNNVAELYRRQHRNAEAESMFNQLLVLRRRVLGADHPNITNVLASLGSMKLEQRGYAEAEPLLREALEGQRKTAPNTWRRYYTESMLGACLSGLGHYPEAEQILISGYKGMLAQQATMPFENRELLAEVRDWIALLYQSWGKPALGTSPDG
ncbi:MAG: serine/threonine protein kinase [Bryobacterales bacterium]|nr:serine/threonine protein kinase [Bryobacterales bacterium]